MDGVTLHVSCMVSQVMCMRLMRGKVMRVYVQFHIMLESITFSKADANGESHSAFPSRARDPYNSQGGIQ